jgi:hypothetical protein
MPLPETETAAGHRGCQYLDTDLQPCGAPRRPGSSYCDHHHALCHLAVGSKAEGRRCREFERIGQAIGGRGPLGKGAPSAYFLRRIEDLQR